MSFDGRDAPVSDVIFASTARTATPTAAEIQLEGTKSRGLVVRINVSASAATPSVVFTIQAYDPGADAWFDVLASAAVTGTGVTLLTVEPDATASANVTARSAIYPRMRVNAVHADSDSITYSATAFATA